MMVETDTSSTWQPGDTLRHDLILSIRAAINAAIENANIKQVDYYKDPPFSDAEARAAIAHAVAFIVGRAKDPGDAWLTAHPDVTEEDCAYEYDEMELEKFVHDLHLAVDPKQHHNFVERRQPYAQP
jgi:hypothetical protein